MLVICVYIVMFELLVEYFCVHYIYCCYLEAWWNWWYFLFKLPLLLLVMRKKYL